MGWWLTTKILSVLGNERHHHRLLDHPDPQPGIRPQAGDAAEHGFRAHQHGRHPHPGVGDPAGRSSVGVDAGFSPSVVSGLP